MALIKTGWTVESKKQKQGRKAIISGNGHWKK